MNIVVITALAPYLEGQHHFGNAEWAVRAGELLIVIAILDVLWRLGGAGLSKWRKLHPGPVTNARVVGPMKAVICSHDWQYVTNGNAMCRECHRLLIVARGMYVYGQYRPPDEIRHKA